MALGFLDYSYDSNVLAYDDENTPIKLCGVKMLPILEWEGSRMNESLDIIAKIDKNNQLPINMENIKQHINPLLDQIGKPVHNLAMPYWIWTPEFNESARHYFVNKKSAKRGPFNLLVQNQNSYFSELVPILKNIEEQLNPFYNNTDFTLNDILIAAHLWGMYIVPEFQFSPKLHNYLQIVKSICNFNYHEDFWR
jgi:glutaredoxin 2